MAQAIPKRLTEKDLDFLTILYRQHELIYDPWAYSSWTPHTAARMRAAGLVRCDQDIERGTLTHPGHWYNVYSYDPDFIRLHADERLLAQVQEQMPHYGHPYPEPVLSEPRRGHLQVVGETFDPQQMPPVGIA